MTSVVASAVATHCGVPKNQYAVRDLIVWQKAMAVAENVYRVTQDFRSNERFSLVVQCRRAATSVVLNIAEGHGRRRIGYFIHFLSIAHGSAAELDTELDTELELAFRLGYLGAEAWAEVHEQLDHVSRLLTNVARSIFKPKRTGD
jgi:four helix bundle protein